MAHDTSGWSWREFWLGLDRWVHAWPIPWLGFGKSTETISSKLGRAHDHWWARALCRFLSLFDRDHCQKAAHGATAPPPNPAPLTKDELKVLRQLRTKVTRRRSPRPQERPPEAP